MTGRYVLHLPFTVADEPAARRLARLLARVLSQFPQVDAGEATVSPEDRQGVQSRLFCDRLLGGGRRCVLPAEHVVPCTGVEAVR